jgi:beta-galactosidase
MPHNYLHELHDRLHDAPRQRYLRELAPMPIGVVFLQRPEMTEADIRGHFRLMKALGFTCLKQVLACPGTTPAHLMHLALEEGIVPWWYDDAGGEPATPELLARLGLPPSLSYAELRRQPAWLDHQRALLHQRIDRQAEAGPLVDLFRGSAIPFSYDPSLHPDAIPAFVAWLQRRYPSLAALNQAWNLTHVDIARDGAFTSWEALQQGLPRMSPREYRHLCDLIRFKADVYLERVRSRLAEHHAREPHEPMRAGGEMGLFLPFGHRCTDMEGIAACMAEGGSFYPSIHLAWHFEEVDFEVPRAVYLQAAVAADWFKGGWSATWESTGGPQQLSGGKGWDAAAAGLVPGVTVNGGTMTQLMLNYLAAGFRGFGFWCWNARSAGWEAGEYALLDRNEQAGERAIAAGRIGQACQRWREELWQARKEPLVGLFHDFDNEIMWAAIAQQGRDQFRHFGVRARVGAGRALINGNLPFEHLSSRDLRQGLGPRYPIIYLSGIVTLHRDWLAWLTDFVRRGGRLVMDAPSAWVDEYGRYLQSPVGSPFEQLFGCHLRDMQFARNQPRQLAGVPLETFAMDLQPTHARVLASFADGLPAVTEARLGSGTAVLLAWDAGMGCFKAGQPARETLLRRYLLGSHQAPFACADALVYRRTAPLADHWFLINDGAARTVALDPVTSTRQATWRDAVSDEPVTPHAIALPAHSGRWLRAAHD